jgi:hypothetical protein
VILNIFFCFAVAVLLASLLQKCLGLLLQAELRLKTTKREMHHDDDDADDDTTTTGCFAPPPPPPLHDSSADGMCSGGAVEATTAIAILLSTT